MPIEYPNPWGSSTPAIVPGEAIQGSRLTDALQLPRADDPWAFKSAYYPPSGSRDPRNDVMPTIAAWPTPYSSPHDLDNYGREQPEMKRAYEDLYRMEPSLRSAVQGKLASVLSLDVTVVPQDEDDPLQQRVAKFVHWSVDRLEMGWEGLAKRVFEPGFLQGWSWTEMILEAVQDDIRYAGLWVPKSFKSKDTDRLRLRLDAYRNVAGVVSTIRGLQEYPTWKGILYSHNSVYENPFGTSDVRSAHRACKLIDAAYQLWYATLKNFSAPFLVGKYTSVATRAQLEVAMQRARAGGWITLAKEDEIEVIDLAAAGSFDAFERKVDKLRQEIFLAIRGAYLPFLEGSAKDARGDTGVNKMASNDVETLLAKLMGRVLTHQYVVPIVRPNFGTEVPPPKLVFGGMNWNETKAQLEAADTIVNKLKIPISADWARKIAQIPGPKDANDVCGPPAQQQQPGMPGIPGGPGGQQPPGAPGAGGAMVPAGGPQSPQPGSPVSQQPPADGQQAGMGGNVSPQDASRIADMFAEVPGADPDWALAVFSSAMDETGHNFDAALQKTHEILRQTPTEPEGTGATTAQFSWSAASTKSGGTKAVGSGPQSGHVLYGADAERALASQGKAKATAEPSTRPETAQQPTAKPSGPATAQPSTSPITDAGLWAKTKAMKTRVSGAASLVDDALAEKGGIPYTAIRSAVTAVHHAMMAVMGQCQKLATQAARERGIPEHRVEAIANFITVADVATSFALSKGGLIASGGNVAASFVAGMMPSASLGYLAYSTARNPAATLRAAKKLVKGDIAPVAAPQQPQTSTMSAETDDSTTLPPEVLAALAHMATADDWEGVDELAALASDPEGLQDFLDDSDTIETRSQFADGGGWTAATTRTGKVKAVWSGGGKSPLYGKRAEQALRAKQPTKTSDSAQGGPAVPKEESKPAGARAEEQPKTAKGLLDTKQLLIQRKAAAEPGRQAAREVWGKAVQDGAMASELPALVDHLHKLTRDELREISRGLEQKVGGLKTDLVKRLVEHAATKAESLDFNIDAMDQGKTGQPLRNQPDRPNPVKAEADARNRWDKGQQVKDKGLGKDPGRGLATPGPLEKAKTDDWKKQEDKRKGNAGEPAAEHLQGPAATKQPWQMTKAEYKIHGPESEQGSTGPKDQQGTMKDLGQVGWHEAYVRAAVNRGEKVPKQVLAEYPQLQKEIKDKSKKTLSSDQSTLTNIIKKSGGIRSDDASFKAHFGSIKEAMEYGISLGIFNKHAKVGLDQMAQSMVYEGHLIVPEGEDPVPYLVEGLMKKARSAAEDLTQKYDKAFEEYSKQQEEAYRESLAESDIEEAIRVGEIDADAAASKDPNGIGNAAADLDFDFGENTSKPEQPKPEQPKGDVIGKGSTGDVVRSGDKVYKNAVNDEGKIYQQLQGVPGISEGAQEGDKIVTPFYKNIVSSDTVKKGKESYGPVIAKNLGDLVTGMSALSALGYDYNDPLQVGFDGSNKAKIIDFSNAEQANPVDARISNMANLSRYLNEFGLPRHGDAIGKASDMLSWIDPEGTRALDNESPEAKMGEHIYNQLGGKDPKYAYYSFNGRTIKGVAQTGNRDGVNLVFSNTPLAPEFVKQWEMHPALTPPAPATPPEAPKPMPVEKPTKKSMAGLPVVEGIAGIKRHPEHEYNGIKIVELPNGEKHNIYRDPQTQAWYHEGSQTPDAKVGAGYLGFDSAGALERLVEGAKSGKFKPNSKE